MVLYQGGTARWNTRTVGAGGTSATMQGDGNFVMYRGGTSAAVWHTSTYGHPGATLHVQDDGNVVLSVGAKVLWATGTGGR